MSAPVADFDALVDPQIGALVILCEGALRANVTLADGSPDAIVRAVYPWPVRADMLGANELPCLCIYRQSEDTVRRTVRHRERRATVVFEYTMPVAPLERVALRWPALAAVWGELVRVVSLGHDPAVADDAPILKTAGVMDIDESDRGRHVEYVKPRPGVDIMPSFVGTMILSHRDEIDISALQALVDLDAQLRLVGTEDALAELEQPLVEEILTNPDP